MDFFFIEIIEDENIMKFIIAATIQLGINLWWIGASIMINVRGS